MNHTICPCGHEQYGYRLKGNALTKYVERSRHLLRNRQAWAVDEIVLYYHRLQVTTIQLFEVEQNHRYTISMDQFFKVCSRINYDHGTQLAVPLRYWETSPTPAGQLEQLKMF